MRFRRVVRHVSCFWILTVSGSSEWAEQMEKNVSFVTRRNFLKTAAAGLRGGAYARPRRFRRRAAEGRLRSISGRSATTAGPGRTNKGRKAMVDGAQRSGRLELCREREGRRERRADPEGPRAEGHQAHLRDVVRLHGPDASRSPSSSRTSSSSIAPATSTPTTSAPTTRASIRAARSRARSPVMMSKSGMIGYLGSYKVPEVVLGVNAFTLRRRRSQPEDHDQAGHDRLVVRSGQGSRRGADARQPRLRRHRPAHRQPGGPAGLRAAQGLVLRPRRRHVALRAEDPA